MHLSKMSATGWWRMARGGKTHKVRKAGTEDRGEENVSKYSPDKGNKGEDKDSRRGLKVWLKW